NDGTLEFITEGAPQAATINNIDLKIRDFGFQAPFTIALNFAALSDQQNFDLSATIGPLINGGVIDVDAIPLKGTAKVGPIQESQLATLPMVAKLIPPKLSISGPISFDATADGTVQSVKFNASSDLSAPAIAFGDAFNKPADQPLKVTAEGTQTPAGVELTLANVTLGDLDAKATNIKFGQGTTAARVDTNNFDIASLAKTIPALAKYNAAGKAEIHTDATVERSKLSANGTMALAGVGLSIPDQKVPPLSNLSGNITLAGTGADLGPLTFNLGAQQATLKAHVDQFQPLVMSYELTAASGNLGNVPYQNLNLQTSVAGKIARVTLLKLKAFSGAIVATGNTRLEPAAPMEASISFTNIDLQQALDSQKSKAAGIVRGALGGNIAVTGKTGSFDEMKPTLKGSGKLNLVNGKLVGVNVGGQALKK